MKSYPFSESLTGMRRQAGIFQLLKWYDRFVFDLIPTTHAATNN
jgi:hypothetical protein